MKTKNLKKGDEVYYLTLNMDNRVISTIERGYSDRRRDEAMILFYTSSAGIVEKVNSKSVRILDAFKRAVTTAIPANRVFSFDPAGYEQAMEEVNRLNNRILKKLNTRIKAGWEMGFLYL
jgi:molybdopterin converting factor small subunit